MKTIIFICSLLMILFSGLASARVCGVGIYKKTRLYVATIDGRRAPDSDVYRTYRDAWRMAELLSDWGQCGMVKRRGEIVIKRSPLTDTLGNGETVRLRGSPLTDGVLNGLSVMQEATGSNRRDCGQTKRGYIPCGTGGLY